MEPFEKFGFPLAGFIGAFYFGYTESMPTSSVLDVAVGNLLCCQCGIEEYRVSVVDHRVILAVDEKDRRAVVRDMVLQ